MKQWKNMELINLTFVLRMTLLIEYVTQGKGFEIFDKSDLVVGIVVPGAATFLGKILMSYRIGLSGRRVGAKGMIWLKFNLTEF